jgi:4-carboxymuconolactone decarboxylase
MTTTDGQLITRAGSQPPGAGPAENFTGEVHVQPLFGPEETAAYGGAYVTFQPGARSAWHTHPAGQRLVVTEGTGRTQQWGGPVERIRAGDVLWCPPGVKHWHGAAPDSAMTHLALTSAGEGGNVTWLEKVSDDQYRAYQPPNHEIGGLTARQRALVAIAAFTATGRQPEVRAAINDGLDAGLTVSQIKEIQVQLYAYAGFPRSINALATFMAVLEDRTANGITDDPGDEPRPLPSDTTSLDLGTRNQTRLIGAPPAGAYLAFAPAIDQFLKAHLFGDIFGRDNLDWPSRELATIAALAAMDGTGAQLRSHFAVGLNTGLTAENLRALVSVLRAGVGQAPADRAGSILDEVLGPAS